MHRKVTYLYGWYEWYLQLAIWRAQTCLSRGYNLRSIGQAKVSDILQSKRIVVKDGRLRSYKEDDAAAAASASKQIFITRSLLGDLRIVFCQQQSISIFIAGVPPLYFRTHLDLWHSKIRIICQKGFQSWWALNSKSLREYRGHLVSCSTVEWKETFVMLVTVHFQPLMWRPGGVHDKCSAKPHQTAECGPSTASSLSTAIFLIHPYSHN